jgi:nicotinamidase-related amidase
MNNRKALLVIDMQKGSFTPQTPRFDADGIVSRINELAAMFRRLNHPYIIIQHDGTGTGEFEKNSSEWENLDELKLEPTDVFIDKYANEVFYKVRIVPITIGEYDNSHKKLNV